MRLREPPWTRALVRCRRLTITRATRFVPHVGPMMGRAAGPRSPQRFSTSTPAARRFSMPRGCDVICLHIRKHIPCLMRLVVAHSQSLPLLSRDRRNHPANVLSSTRRTVQTSRSVLSVSGGETKLHSRAGHKGSYWIEAALRIEFSPRILTKVARARDTRLLIVPISHPESLAASSYDKPSTIIRSASR